ncbi:MAG TPA: o-succinylbenzoate--CoA ligase [Ktedonobacterales bacterium]|nr:o-succinylbenzoate--CoA ligase [Ktedonobacterales bacterium]
MTTPISRDNPDHPGDAPDRMLPDWLRRCAENTPDRMALRQGATRWSFADLDRRATAMATRLAALGARAGDRVALLADNSLAFASIVHALTRLGAILVPLNTRLTAAELAWQVGDARVALLIADTRHTELAAEAAQIARAEPPIQSLVLAILGGRGVAEAMSASDATQPGDNDASVAPSDAAPTDPPAFDDILIRYDMVGKVGEAGWHAMPHQRAEIDLSATQAIIFTSGTTGRPKGAIITYGMLWWNAVGSALNLGHQPDDVWLASLPFFHIGGLSILMRSVIYGIGVSVFPHFDAETINAEILAGDISIISVVAVTLQRMLAALDAKHVPPNSSSARDLIATDPPRYPARLRCVLLGGGPAPRPLLEDCARRGIPIAQTYGMTESCSQATTLAPADALRRLGSAGRPLAPVRLRVVRDVVAGMVAEAGEPGEIELRGPTITPGYDGNAEATARAFHGGWLTTGDIGYLDADGYLYLLDRRADLIISGGENVYPAEIESALLAHPAVAEAGVCGVADAQWGQAPVAFVRLREGMVADATTADALRAFAAARLARYKTPRAVYLVPALPRNSAGKLLRRELPGLLPG